MIRHKISELNWRLRNWLHSFPTGPILVLVQGLSAWMWWVAGSYFGLDTFYSRSFESSDKWCDPSIQGLGVHCWGDYYSLTLAFMLNPESPYLGGDATAYAPAGLLFIQAFNQVSLVFGQPALGLVLYLGLMISTISWSIWKGTFGLKLERRLVLFATLTFFAPPIIMVLDRGNTVGFLVPLLIWYFHALREGKNLQIVVAVALMSIIKPHFGVMVIALLISGKIKVAAKTALFVVFVNVVPFFILWGSEFLTFINQWLLVFFGYQGVSSPSNPFPTNISFSHSILIIATGLRNSVSGEFTTLLSLVEKNYGLIGFAVGVILFFLISAFRMRLTTNQISILVVSCISLLSGTTFFYYAVFVIPVLLTFVTQAGMNSERESLVGHQRLGVNNHSIDLIIWFASLATLIQFPIFDLTQGSAIVTTSSLIGGVWLLAYIAIAFVLVNRNTQFRKNRPAESSAKN